MTHQAGRVRGCMRLVTLLAALAAMLPGAARAEALDALLARVIAAYGGAERLAAVQRFHATGTTSSRRTGTRGPSERWFARPDRLRIDIRYSATHVESRILDGQRSWKDGAPVNEPFRSAMVLQAARFELPLLLVQRPVRDGGEVLEAGRALRLVAVDLPGGMRLEALIDPASAHIVRSRGLALLNGQPLEFATAYGDFRKVGGVLFAHREEHFAMGMHTGDTVLTRIDLDPAFGPGVFRP